MSSLLIKERFCFFRPFEQAHRCLGILQEAQGGDTGEAALPPLEAEVMEDTDRQEQPQSITFGDRIGFIGAGQVRSVLM